MRGIQAKNCRLGPSARLKRTPRGAGRNPLPSDGVKVPLLRLPTFRKMGDWISLPRRESGPGNLGNRGSLWASSPCLRKRFHALSSAQQKLGSHKHLVNAQSPGKDSLHPSLWLGEPVCWDQNRNAVSTLCHPSDWLGFPFRTDQLKSNEEFVNSSILNCALLSL